MQRHTCSAFIFHFHIFPCWEQILLCHERLDVDSRDRRSIPGIAGWAGHGGHGFADAKGGVQGAEVAGEGAIAAES